MAQAKSADEGDVLLRHDADGIATLTLNRPASGNSLSHALVGELSAMLRRIAADAEVRVVVLAAKIASKSSAAVSRGKRSFHAQYDLNRADAYAHVESVIPEAFETEDAKEGIAAFLEKRPPRWRGK